MPIAITEDHRALGRPPRTSSPSAMPEGPPGRCSKPRPKASRRSGATWLPSGGWACTCPRTRGGSGFGLPELVVVVEELGRAVAPGPFVPTVIASAVIDAAGSDGAGGAPAARAWPTGRYSAASGCRPTSRCAGGRAGGTAPAVLGGGLAHVLVLPAGDDAVVVDVAAGGVTVDVPANLDPTRRTRPGDARRRARRGDPRRAAQPRRPGAPPRGGGGGRRGARVHRAGRRLRQGARAVRPAHRHVPGRQAPLRQHARCVRAGHRGGVGRRPGGRGGRRPALVRGAPWPPHSRWRPADECAQLNIQVHGGIGFTWEHDAHLYLRRATALEAVVDAEAAAPRRHRLRPREACAGRGSRRPAARGRADARRGAILRRAGARASTRRASAKP